MEHFLPRPVLRAPGRPQAHRASLARSFLAKMVLNIPATAGLHERIRSDTMLRSLCGWCRSCDVPSISTFSCAFQEFAATALPSRLHEALIPNSYREHLVGHISRDSTAIEAREKAVPKKKKPAPVARKRGRPKKGDERPKAPNRLARQRTMTLKEMLSDLPKECRVSCKRNAKGSTQFWTGYKLHMDVADGRVPISCLVTSASLHDSQAAIPLATLTVQRVDHCYDLMDSAYDAKAIHAHSRASGQVPVETGRRVVARIQTRASATKQIQDTGLRAHPVMGLSFTARREHPSHHQDRSPVDLTLVKVQGSQDLGKPQRLQCLECHALPAHRARVGMMDLMGQDGISILARVMDIIALLSQPLNDVLPGLHERLIFQGQACGSAQFIHDPLQQRPLLPRDVELFPEIEQGPLTWASMDTIGFGQRIGIRFFSRFEGTGFDIDIQGRVGMIFGDKRWVGSNAPEKSHYIGGI